MPTPPEFPVAGKTPGVKSEILIGGVRFPVSGDVNVVTYADEGAYSFYTMDSPDGMPMFGGRYEKPGVPVKTLDQLFEVLHQLVIHTDLSQDSAGCFRALVGRSLSTHFMVEWDGMVWQPLDIMHCGYHAGDANQKSIGLDVNNVMHNLEREPETPTGDMQGGYPKNHPRFAEMSKKEFTRPVSDKMEINGPGVRAFGYTDAQYTGLIELLKVLRDRFKNLAAQYPVDAKGDVVTRVLDDPAGFNGFMAHWQWEAQRWDPGPGFDFQRVFHSLGREHNSFPIELTESMNIGSLLVPDKVRAYAENYYKNNETQTTGWYPMGVNQTWHGGIHLAAAENKQTPVLAMTDGVLVAARFGKQPTKLGHNNFVLLKHTIPIPAKNKDAKGKEFVFFSLYMHLEPIDCATLGEDSPGWLREMYRIDSGKTADEEKALEEGDDKDDKDKKDGKDKKDEKKKDDDAGDGDSGEIVDPDAIDTKGYLELGDGLTALKNGAVAKIAYADKPVKVRSGDPLGFVGKFGNPGDWKRQVHVEVFADTGWKDAIDIGIHGRYLTELDDDVGEDLYVENNDILSLFGGPKTVIGLNPKKTLDSTAIEYFWSSDAEFQEEKRYLRKVVVRHVSEWSDKVDWVTSLSAGESWDDKVNDFKKILKGSSLGKEAISTVLPFTWLSKDLAEHIGIDVKEWRGLLDHLHPLHFLMWLTFNSSQRVQSFSTGLTKKQAEKKAREEADKIEKARQAGQQVQNEDEGTTIIEFLDDTAVEDAGTVLDQWKNGRDQGEWKREEVTEE